ncbi:kinesin motor domain-containing protein [Xylaria bambusicola]|uniref:kinesin motor domain-containing protein n=1 Tax=Xylaria bambusicola TaxID=326684 RepID=UPI0020084EF8|nr:kinesin motor domain-containing protein [Xylaria bambusicola]KAI0509143.1 kinesin motor domain-containing protein [Xylaria bambusicola]
MSAIDPGASSITVAVRVRPFTIREAAQIQRHDDGTVFLGDGSLAGAPTPRLKQGGIRSVIKVIDDRCLVFDPPEDNPIQKFSRSVVPQGKKVKDQTFAFDRIFDENTTQTEVYEATTKGLLDSVLDGYNATVFAYGATGCGKTHTITGTTQMPGIIFLTMQELFEKINDCRDEKHTEITLSYLEIYNETIRDLLVPGGSKQGLMLREDSNQAVTVSGLTSHHPKDVQEVMDMIVKGNEYRTVSPTDANATSSRSHAVLQINIAMKDRNAAVNEPHTMATLSIIDLAGSERASATKNRGERLIEGANINKSLLALGGCINALCDPRRNSHVPYRNSKLTRLLKFSLGGNCKTVMIVCVSPSSAHYDETQNTLRYANRAKNIQTKVTRNVFNVNRHVKDYLVKIDEQRTLINELQAQMKDSEQRFFAKFRKQMEKKDASVREGVQRIRIAYDNSLAERQDKVAHMKKLRGIERRIGLLSSWVAAFDTVCDTREDEDAMPSTLSTMRKTAQGILLELENSRHHLHQKLNKTNWERAIDGALQHSISQLPNDGGDTGEIASLTREAELVKSNFAREAYREVMEQEKAGDAATVQALLTAQFEILTSLSETIHMSEEEAVAHARDIIHRMLETGFSAASQVVKPDGAKMQIEAYPPTKRGTPKRKRNSILAKDLVKPIPNPALAAVAASEPSSSQVFLSPIKGSPRRRKAVNPRKGVSFSSPKKRTPSKRSVRWRDDDGEDTLADFEKTPQKLSPVSEHVSPEKPLPQIREILSPVKENDDAAEESSPSLLVPEMTSLTSLPSKPSRFQAGFLSKTRQSTSGASPVAPKMSLNLGSPSSGDERASPLRNLDISSAANIRAPGRRYTSLSPKPNSAPFPTSLPVPSPSSGDENHPPSSSDSETSALIDSSKLRSAIHANKKPRRMSSLASATMSSAGGANLRRVSSVSSFGGHRASNAYHSSSSLSSSANGVSRLRRGSAERRRSPPIHCSPPDLHLRDNQGSRTAALTNGQARRMNLGSSSLRVSGWGSPGEKEADHGKQGPRRITIGGAAMAGAGAKSKGGLIWR